MMISHLHMPLCAKLTYQLKLVLAGLSFQGEFPWKQHTKISHHSYEFAEDLKWTEYTPPSAFSLSSMGISVRHTMKPRLRPKALQNSWSSFDNETYQVLTNYQAHFHFYPLRNDKQ